MRHTGENLLNDQQIYHCEFCEYTTSRTDNLKRHSKRHTGEPMLQKQDTNNGEFSCNICDKSFARRENLRRHEQIHSGIRPFSCHVCEKSFRQRNELVYHQSRNVYFPS